MRFYERCDLLNEFHRIVREHPLMKEFPPPTALARRQIGHQGI
jgi:hypothetical protein